jgi:amino acid permease
MQTARNVAIIMLLALAVAFVPGGDAAADTTLSLLAMAFLAAIAWFVYTVYRQQRLTIDTLPDSRKAILFGAIGLIVFCIAATDQFSDWGGGAMVGWLVLLAVAVVAIIAVWREATTYS